MRISNLGGLAVLFTAAAASRCRHPSSSKSPVVAVPSSVVPSSSVPSSSVPVSSTPVSSSAIVSSTSEPACGGKCFAAITAEPAVGEAFCSSFLSLEPETTTVTEVASVTSTRTNLATVTSLLTLTTATTTKVSGATTIFQKRRGGDPTPVAQDTPSESILSVCSYASDRVSSACGCYISTTATVTITETTTFTEIPEVTSTLVETSTTAVIKTESAMATTTIPPQPLVNPGFENYMSTQNLLPWETVVPTNGRIEPIYPISVCASNGVCGGGQVIVRIYPGTSGGGYTALKQTFQAKPSTRYSFSMLARCLNYDSSTRMTMLYNGQTIGDIACANGNFNVITSSLTFLTDGTGRGTLEVRFRNPTNLPYLYFYADKFEATVAGG
ncbi:hypothetical protein V8F06_013897 [Rhypophila decipiens]